MHEHQPFWMSWNKSAEKQSFHYACEIKIAFTKMPSDNQDLDLSRLWKENV